MFSLTDYIKELNKTGELMREHLDPFRNFCDSLQKSIAPFVEWQENFKTIATSLATQALIFQEALVDGMRPVLAELERAYRELPPHTQKALLTLGEHGWYMDSQMMTFHDLLELEKALLDGNITEAETLLISHFENRLEDIETWLLHTYPSRAHIMKPAFNAHRREEYVLSIPIFLAQTDGICKEMAGYYLFIKSLHRPSTAKYVDQMIGDTFEAALLSPLTVTLPISASEKERQVGNEALKRHTVLHGESLDYGTKVNSLKAVSLINYVANSFKEHPDDSGKNSS